MFKTNKQIPLLLIVAILTISFSCSSQKQATQSKAEKSDSVLPFSDPTNSGNWKLNTDVSDEFNAKEIDEDKWYIVGKFENGKPVYKHPDKPNKKVWIGRAPSQFSGRNYRLEDGKLMLETRWEPDFPFSEEPDKPVGGVRYEYENLTTACFIGRKEFKYGYMEIKSKAADAEITSSFWATGNGAEFDMFEMFGDHRQPNKLDKDRELWWSIHDLTKDGKGKSVYTEHRDLGFRVADDFHVYGIDWSETGIKYYVDGKLFFETTRDEINAWDDIAKKKGGNGEKDNYVITNPIHIWLDQETFTWHGVPDSLDDLELNSPEGKKKDGVIDFEIEYVRVWQKN